MPVTTTRTLPVAILREVQKAVIGKDLVLTKVLLAFLAGGHVLMEDMPGVGKTTLAMAFSKALGLNCRRVQFTPDVLPSDLTGFSVYEKNTGTFVFQPGALFCHLLLADEINRTSSKTQAALLEALQQQAAAVYVDDRLYYYAASVSRATREHPQAVLGVSPRGTLALIQSAKAMAMLRGRDYLLPDDIMPLCQDVLAHRILTKGGVAAEQVLDEVLHQVPAPMPDRR